MTCEEADCAHLCQKTSEGPKCSCRTGYKLSNDTRSCAGKLDAIITFENPYTTCESEEFSCSFELVSGLWVFISLGGSMRKCGSFLGVPARPASSL